MDRHFSEKARYRMNTMSTANLNKMLKMARSAGVNTQGKFYVGGLGRYTDQKAWCSTADDVLAVAKERNFTVTGAVKHKGHEVAPRVGPALAPDIVQRHVKKILASEPRTREKVRKDPKKLNEVKERVIAKHAPRRRVNV